MELRENKLRLLRLAPILLHSKSSTVNEIKKEFPMKGVVCLLSPGRCFAPSSPRFALSSEEMSGAMCNEIPVRSR